MRLIVLKHHVQGVWGGLRPQRGARGAEPARIQAAMCQAAGARGAPPGCRARSYAHATAAQRSEMYKADMSERNK